MLGKEDVNLVLREIESVKKIQKDLSHQTIAAADILLEIKDCMARAVLILDAFKAALIVASTDYADADQMAKDIAELGCVKFWDCYKHDGRLRPRNHLEYDCRPKEIQEG